MSSTLRARGAAERHAPMDWFFDSLPESVPDVKLCLTLRGNALPGKAMIIVFNSTNSEGLNSTKQAIDLPWSRLVSGAFVNWPGTKTGQEVIELQVPVLEPISSISISVETWGQRKHFPREQIVSAWVKMTRVNDDEEWSETCRLLPLESAR